MKKIIYSALIMLVIIHGINGMEKEETGYPGFGGWLFDQPIVEESLEPISCKKNKWVLAEELILEKETRHISRESKKNRDAYSLEELAATPRKQNTIQLPAVDLTYTNKKIYFLGKDEYQQKNIFSKKLTESNIIDVKKLPVHFLFYKNPYFFYQFSETNQINNFLVSDQLTLSIYYQINHNKPISSFGTIENTIFSSSTWPSIKKSTVPTSRYNPKTEPFIDNAFLLACQDNGMVIAKINQENNAKFWFWRRFNTTKDVQVTLYGLFFEPKKSIQNITKKMVETALDQAKEQYSLENKNFTKKNTYSTDNITVVTLATNVVLTAEQQANPNKKFPKAALSNNTALVIHTKRYNPDDKTDAFPIQNPAVSIAYKDKQNNWNTGGPFQLKYWISKQKPIGKNKNYIRLPDLYEIKDVYITQHNNQLTALLVTQTDGLGFCADGIYAIPLTGQENYVLPEPLWYVDILYNKKTKSWQPIEKIVASTFDYDNKKLFLITESIPKKTTHYEKVFNQQLITIDITEAMNAPQRLEKIDENKSKIRKK